MKNIKRKQEDKQKYIKEKFKKQNTCPHIIQDQNSECKYTQENERPKPRVPNMYHYHILKRGMLFIKSDPNARYLIVSLLETQPENCVILEQIGALHVFSAGVRWPICSVKFSTLFLFHQVL